MQVPGAGVERDRQPGSAPRPHRCDFGPCPISASPLLGPLLLPLQLGHHFLEPPSQCPHLLETPDTALTATTMSLHTRCKGPQSTILFLALGAALRGGLVH